MINQRLRDSLLSRGVSLESAATHAGVDTKTVERWVTQGRNPYPRHRRVLAQLLGETETYLWPDAVLPTARAQLETSALLTLYPSRNAIPADVWRRLLARAESQIDVLVYAGMFLMEDPGFIPTLCTKAAAGAHVRLLFGDPDSVEVRRRSEEEGIGPATIATKIRNCLALARPLADAVGVEIRCHATTLYNSLYVYDDEMIVNPHVFGRPAPHAPAMHLRRLAGGSVFDTYEASFQTVWDGAAPVQWDP